MPALTEEQLKNVADDFYSRWQFPNCIGCIDGKHIRIKQPPNSGRQYFNYKQYFSIVLQAVADANYRFLNIEVGAYGRQSDGGIFASSDLYRRLESNSYNVPEQVRLPGTDVFAPFVILGDEAYPLKYYLLRPYREKNGEEKLFNDFHSRTRKVVECAFGILTSKWQILQKPLETDIKTTNTIVKTICLLHNIIIDSEGVDNGVLLQVEKDLTTTKNRTKTTGALNRATFAATNVRNVFKT